MARLTEADAARLVQALGAPAPDLDRDTSAVRARSEPRSAAGSKLLDAARHDALGRAITLDLAAYLRRPVRCSVGIPPPAMTGAWRYRSTGGMPRIWVDIEPDLGAAFADATIGGHGTAALGAGRRVRSIAELAASRIIDAIADAAGLARPQSIRFAADISDTPAIAGGTCGVAAEQYPWSFGIDQLETLPESPAVREPSAPAVEPLARAVRPQADAAETLKNAVAAMCERLRRDSADASIARESYAGSDVDASASIEAEAGTELRLALTAGGNGALVASADGPLVRALSAAASDGARGGLEPSRREGRREPGPVVLAGAESVLRPMLDALAGAMPVVAGSQRRTVRLSEAPLPARVPHRVADVTIALGGASGRLRLLVPTWMLHASASAAPREDRALS